MSLIVQVASFIDSSLRGKLFEVERIAAALGRIDKRDSIRWRMERSNIWSWVRQN